MSLLAAVQKQRLRVILRSPAPKSSTAAATPMEGGQPGTAEVGTPADQQAALSGKKRAVPIDAPEPAAKRRPAETSATAEERALPIPAAEDHFAVGSPRIPEQPDFQLQPLPPLEFQATAPQLGGQGPSGQPTNQGTATFWEEEGLTTEEVMSRVFQSAGDMPTSSLLDDGDVRDLDLPCPFLDDVLSILA